MPDPEFATITEVPPSVGEVVGSDEAYVPRLLTRQEDNFALAVIEYGGNLASAYKAAFGESQYYEIHPYFLKQYNNRWFLFGLHPESWKHDWNVAIDRIITVHESKVKFIPNEEIDWQSVQLLIDKQIKKVELKLSLD